MDSVILEALTTPLLGGVLVGLAATGMLWTHGRIAGVSGFMRAAISAEGRDRSGPVAFLGGMLAGGSALAALAPAAVANTTSGSLGQAVVAGVLVGAGSQLANGCTSGHTLGLGRFSLRSVAALSLFVAVGAVGLLCGRYIAGGAA